MHRKWVLGLAATIIALCILAPNVTGEELQTEVQAIITDSISPAEKMINITAQNLQPNGVYTVWLVDSVPEGAVGVGPVPHAFTADERGLGSFSATIPASDIIQTQTVKIVHHRDGNPENMSPADTEIIYSQPISDILIGEPLNGQQNKQSEQEPTTQPESNPSDSEQELSP